MCSPCIVNLPLDFILNILHLLEVILHGYFISVIEIKKYPNKGKFLFNPS
jgi:hypothetical protein